MNQTLEESREVQDERLRMISNMIKMVLKKRMSWETLESLLNNMASSPSKSKQIIKILINELKTLNSKSQTEVSKYDIPSIEINTMETDKTEDFSEDLQIMANSDKSVIDDFEEDIVEKIFEGNENYSSYDFEADFANESFSVAGIEASNFKEIEEVIENLVHEYETESSNIQIHDTESEQIEELDIRLENELYEFIGDKSDNKLKVPENDYDDSSNEGIQKSNNTFRCNICSKDFKRKHHLMQHESCHTEEKPFKCKQCGKCFREKGKLNRHVRIHTGTKPFQCKHCSKSFTRSDSLEIHERTHSGEKPFKCESCSKSFKRSNSLRYHEKVHTGEKPFECKSCGKFFAHNFHLKNHERTHTGERPYKCKTCSKSFTQSSHLNAHKKKKHPSE